MLSMKNNPNNQIISGPNEEEKEQGQQEEGGGDDKEKDLDQIDPSASNETPNPALVEVEIDDDV